jgi:3-oxoacyl-[acyl-carrier-protein] synthase II
MSSSIAKSTAERRVVITGIGIVAPNGLSVSEFWRNTVNGVSGIRRFSAFDASDYPCKIAGEVVGFDPALYFRETKSVKRSERFEQFAVAASKMALEDANIDLEPSIGIGSESQLALASADSKAWKDQGIVWSKKGRPVSLHSPSPE